MPHGIMVFGANGSGKTTLGRALADALGYKHMDIETYHFLESEIPYTRARSRENCLAYLRADMEKYGAFVLSAVTGDFGEEIEKMYDLAVWLSAPKALRMARIEQREIDRFGDRVRAGGDLYEQEARFLAFAASRPLDRIDRWAETLSCPLLRLDGARPLTENVNLILECCRALGLTESGNGNF